MWQILFKIPFVNFPIFSYGLMLVIGFFGGKMLAERLAKRVGLDPMIFTNCALIALVAGVAGARLSHVLENWPQYSDPSRSAWANFLDAVNIRSGGLTYYGGFLLATPAVLAYGILKRAPLRLGMDIIAPCLMIGLGFGRIGCFLNGCCYGSECNVPWAVTFPYGSNPFMDEFQNNTLKAKIPDELLGPPNLVDGRRWPLPASQVGPQPEIRSNPLHPAQLYSSFTAFLIAAFLLAYFTMPHAPGQVFGLMMAVEGLCRFLLETLRAEPAIRHFAGHGFSLGMIEGLVICAAGVVLWLVFGALRNLPAPQPTPVRSESSAAAA
jgi:phosphatidylglycerol:prolipoprotein diacylglycerol transferase